MYGTLTNIGEFQLSAYHSSIRFSPCIIAYCAPDILSTEFHSAFSGVTTINQSDSPVGAN